MLRNASFMPHRCVPFENDCTTGTQGRQLAKCAKSLNPKAVFLLFYWNELRKIFITGTLYWKDLYNLSSGSYKPNFKNSIVKRWHNVAKELSKCFYQNRQSTQLQIIVILILQVQSSNGSSPPPFHKYTSISPF